MKDYYYILGVKHESNFNEIRAAYRKLSIKFHPDKNDGDDFFSERFKEINEAYEVLSDRIKRISYDKAFIGYSLFEEVMQPKVEFFTSNKAEFKYGEEINFSWKTSQADKVEIIPFGNVEKSGSKSYKLLNYKNDKISIKIIARSANDFDTKEIVLENRTYNEMYNHFKSIFVNKNTNNSNDSYSTYNPKETEVEKEQEDTIHVAVKVLSYTLIFILLILVIYYLRI